VRIGTFVVGETYIASIPQRLPAAMRGVTTITD